MQRNNPPAVSIMDREVHRVRFLIRPRKGRAKMNKIWLEQNISFVSYNLTTNHHLISFPENTQAVSFDFIPNCFSMVERTAVR